MKWKNNLAFYMSLLFIGVSNVIFWQSMSLEYYSSLGPGPGLFPRWLSGIFMLLSVLYMISTIRQPIVWSEVMPSGKDLRNVGLVVASVASFALVLTEIGFVMAGFLATVLLLARSYTWPRASAIALSVNLAIYFTFTGWLDVPLPSGEWWDWMG